MTGDVQHVGMLVRFENRELFGEALVTLREDFHCKLVTEPDCFVHGSETALSQEHGAKYLFGLLALGRQASRLLAHCESHERLPVIPSGFFQHAVRVLPHEARVVSFGNLGSYRGGRYKCSGTHRSFP
ncbi:uncharacterized protein LOC112343737 [Selaginella moellendorffii]|uniref:uncharacterized protein LOC112343737 n=1 Tax=Selaginella moellendorffii TaxID=88036 RepID=UPI000D1C6E27|nr:uncharacterized protein LOC112343737 [Selaginella moellendorffii]|eukprot:XP_024523508.1 uncharacterized protein LOC112343737 [Selaginella moellendorffii]